MFTYIFANSSWHVANIRMSIAQERNSHKHARITRKLIIYWTLSWTDRVYVLFASMRCDSLQSEAKIKIENNKFKLNEGDMKKKKKTKTQTIDARQQSPTLCLCVLCRTIECTKYNWRTPHFSIYCFTYRTIPFSVWVRSNRLDFMLGIIMIQSLMNRNTFRKCIFATIAIGSAF